MSDLAMGPWSPTWQAFLDAKLAEGKVGPMCPFPRPQGWGPLHQLEPVRVPEEHARALQARRAQDPARRAALVEIGRQAGLI